MAVRVCSLVFVAATALVARNDRSIGQIAPDWQPRLLVSGASAVAVRQSGPVGETLAPSFTVLSPDGATTGSIPIVTGVPMAAGQMVDAAAWHVETVSGAAVPAQLTPAARWPDGRVRVVHVALVADVRPSGGLRYQLVRGAPARLSDPLVVGDADGRLTVRGAGVDHAFDKRALIVDGRSFTLSSRGVEYVATPYEAPRTEGMLGVAQPWEIEVAGPLMAVVKVEGSFKSGSREFDPLVRFRARLTFWRAMPAVRVEFTLRQNHSYGWNDGPFSGPVRIDDLRVGSVNLLPRGTHQFGAGLEKTFDLTMGGGQVNAFVLDWDPDRRYPNPAPRPVGFPDPAYVESTGSFGTMVAPLTGVSAERGEALAGFERLQRANVIAADAEGRECEAPPTIIDHLAVDRGSWRDYGDLRWASDCAEAPFSRNHYDWVASLYMHALRTGRVELYDAAQLLARHEIDLDLYHTGDNGPWFNYQKNWENGMHDGPANCFGAGRPSHTWNRGYLLHYLWAGERRGLDAVRETVEGARGYLYEAAGHPLEERELRTPGWLTVVLVTRYLLDPTTPLPTPNGPVTPRQAVADAVEGIVNLEERDGQRGFVRGEQDGSDVAVLQMLYASEALIDAYEHVLRGSGHPLEARLRNTTERVVRFIMSATFGGETRGRGYVPVQLPYTYAVGHSNRQEGQVAWMLMAANATGWLWTRGAGDDVLAYARRAFRDFVFYREVDGDAPVNPRFRTPAGYGSCYFTGTESKLQGWAGRFGQWYLAAEREAQRQGR